MLELLIKTGGFFINFGVNIIAAFILCFVLYYRRYKNKQLFTTAMLFNIFVFAVLSIISSVEFGVGLGFGLFAILAIFRLRSEQLEKVDITYFFGSISIAVINAVSQPNLITLMCNCVILLGAWLVDHESFLRGVERMKVSLDHIDERLVSNKPVMCAELGKKFGIDVISFKVKRIDYVKDIANIDLSYRQKHGTRRTKR